MYDNDATCISCSTGDAVAASSLGASSAVAGIDTIGVRVVTALMMTSGDKRVLKHKRRYCRVPGCTRIVKSQGLCQRHGATPRRCRVEACTKQAQGSFNGMCKSHFKEQKRVTAQIRVGMPLNCKKNKSVSRDCVEKVSFSLGTTEILAPVVPLPPDAESVYDRVIPASLSWRPANPPIAKDGDEGAMPLVVHLKQGFDTQKPPAWHRNEERRARGLWPVHSAVQELEGWERELVWTESLLLAGSSDSSFYHLAHGWGRDNGFHLELAQTICKSHGDIERKNRQCSDTDCAATPSLLSPAASKTALAATMASQLEVIVPASKSSGATCGTDVFLVPAGKEADSTNSCNYVPQENDPSASLYLLSKDCGARIDENVWDDVCHVDLAFDEALAAELLDLSTEYTASTPSSECDNKANSSSPRQKQHGGRFPSWTAPGPNSKGTGVFDEGFDVDFGAFTDFDYDEGDCPSAELGEYPIEFQENYQQ